MKVGGRTDALDNVDDRGGQVTATVEAAEPFTHSALFYRGMPEYLAGILPFIHGGLEAGEPVMAAVAPPKLERLRTELGAASARVRLVDMSRAGRNPGRIIPQVLHEFADAHPRGRVRMIGEPIRPGVSAAAYPACVQHEALINLAFSGRAVTILCPYDAEGLEGQALDDACATHPVVVDSGEEQVSAAYAPDRVLRTYNAPLPEPAVRPSTLTFDSANLSEVRALVVEQGHRAGLTADRAIDAELAVNELAANSLAHGGGAGRLRVWTQDGHLICEVSDAGWITDPLVGRRPVAPGVAGGRGVLVVNYLSDLVRMHTGQSGTTVRAHFAF